MSPKIVIKNIQYGLLWLMLISLHSALQCMDQRDRDNMALVIAAENGDLERVQFLLAPRAHVNTIYTESHDGKIQRSTPVRQAAQNNHYQVLKCLLDNNADPNLTTDVAPLFVATINGHNQAVDVLLQANADPNIATEDGGLTALIIAAEYGNLPIVQSLLRARAHLDLHAHKVHGITALTQAAQEGHTPVVRTLIKAKANINKASAGGDTPLHDAARNGHLAIVRLLIAAGAHRNVQNLAGLRPIDYAKNEPIRQLLQKRPLKKRRKVCAKSENADQPVGPDSR